MRPKVVVLHNLPGKDREASDVGVIEEVEDVSQACRTLGYATSRLGVDGTNLWGHLQHIASDRTSTVVFNLCEGLDGVARHEFVVAGLMDLSRVYFTGSTALTLACCLDKWVAKSVLRSAGIPVPKGCVYSQVPKRTDPPGLAFPAIAKPLREDGSLGLSDRSVVSSFPRLREQVAWLLETFRQPVLVESYLPGREFNVGVVGDCRSPKALPPAEIRFVGYEGTAPRVLTHAAKWDTGSDDDLRTQPVCPADINEDLAARLRELAERSFTAVGCRDYARVDFRLDSVDLPQVIEVNPNPDIARSAGLARAVRASGRTYEDLIAEILERTWKRSESAGR
jgi:D-alanine-D-alanine ligase